MNSNFDRELEQIQTVQLIAFQSDLWANSKKLEGSKATPTPWLTRIRFTQISLTRLFKRFPFLT